MEVLGFIECKNEYLSYRKSDHDCFSVDASTRVFVGCTKMKIIKIIISAMLTSSKALLL